MKGGVFALGNFDGVHRGHRLVIEAVVEKARALALPARVITFEPHPREFFQPSQPPFRLTPPAHKARLLHSLGIADVFTLHFNANLAHLLPQEFVKHILIAHFGVQHVIAGQDFTFGKGRSGNMAMLATLLEPYTVPVTEIPALNDGEGQVISSTRIRDMLRLGDVGAASALLGHDWSIEGRVNTGAQRGRTIGVPTANLYLGDYLRPAYGVYAVRAGRVGEPLTYKGVANIGIRPTVDEVIENLEAHLFDFDQDIYGEQWQVALTHFIRPEKKFLGLDLLKEQIVRDIDEAKRILDA
jgi:riboflavin kinase/FMN adenylyltransferase